MTVTQLKMRFANLARHSIWLVTTERKKITRFIDGLNYNMSFCMAREAKTDAGLDKVVEIATRLDLVRRQECEERAAKIPNSSGGFSSASSRGQSHYNRGRSSRPVQAAQRMVGKGCMAYLASVKDINADAPTVESVSIVRDFLDVFPADLAGMPPERDNHYDIDLV
ncbi:uncharacterized protein [Nicotiana tomentosiformis]|uniref:uncharacterized protein n=1 Tax=Nicotiana tomentosiformis TaxID=4098 RepID=UPI00388C44F9